MKKRSQRLQLAKKNFNNTMKVVTEEIKNYRKAALEASAAGDSELAHRWRMAADQANNFYLQQRWPHLSGKTSKIEEKNKRPLVERASGSERESADEEHDQAKRLATLPYASEIELSQVPYAPPRH